MYLGEALLQAAQHLAEPFEGQFRMQSADDVEFGDGFVPSFAGAMPNVFERHRVGSGILSAFAKGAQAATSHADVSWIDIAVDVEIGGVAMQLFANQIGHVANAQNVARTIQ